MVKANRQKLLDSELDHVEFWANWREAGRAMGITPSPKRVDKFGQYMENAIANFEAESLFMAFKKADKKGWTKYVQDYPPSPEALAILVILGLEEFQSQKGRMAGHKSGVARRNKLKCKPEEVARLYEVYMASGTEERNIAAKLATRFSVTPNHIRNLRKQAKK
jgi:hypothetical protein